MIYFQQLEELEKTLSYQVQAGAQVVLRIDLRSQLVAPAVVQPKMAQWLSTSGNAVAIEPQILPIYTYLPPKGVQSITIAFKMPDDVKAGERLFTTLRFSTLAHCSMRVEMEVLPITSDEAHIIFEQHAELNLPLYQEVANKQENESSFQSSAFYTESILHLLQGLEGLEKLPSRWLVTELILTLVETGYHRCQDPENELLIKKLKRTIFFKNGALVTAGSQLMNWLSVSTSINSGLRALLGRTKKREERVLQNWEKWMLNMVQADIETMHIEGAEIHFDENQSFDEVLTDIGNEPEKLFLYFVMGIMEVAPRLKAVILQVCDQIPDAEVMETPSSPIVFKDILNEEGSLQR